MYVDCGCSIDPTPLPNISNITVGESKSKIFAMLIVKCKKHRKHKASQSVSAVPQKMRPHYVLYIIHTTRKTFI